MAAEEYITGPQPFLRRFAQRCEIGRLRLFSVMAAIFIYALWGSPTPDRPGAPEILIGACLILAVSPGAVKALIKPNIPAPDWLKAGWLLGVYGFSIAFTVALIEGQDLILILRDMAAFLFLLLPVFLYPVFRAGPKHSFALLIAVCLCGLIFSLRALAELYQISFSVFNTMPPAGERLYLANAPTVLFAGLFLIGLGGRRYIHHPSLKSLIGFLALAALGLTALLPLGLTLQRASLGYAAIYILALTGLALYFYPRRAILPVFLLGTAALLLWPVLDTLSDALMQKTALHGLNMRLEEWQAVLSVIADNPISMMFGLGWGGALENPAVAGLRVNFTHSLLSAALLKTGLIGFFLTGLYLWGLARAGLKLLRRDPVLALALTGPVLIPVFLYASYKSFDFGLILLLLAGSGQNKI